MKETLRMKPPIGYMSKICTEKTELTDQKEKSVSIEKGVVIGIPVYSIHNDPEYYIKPSEFNPDRFNVENGGIKRFKDKGVWLGFGDGPRVCLVTLKITSNISNPIIECIYVIKFEQTYL